MRTVGQYLKEIRLLKGVSRKDLERQTKIKKDFIDAIEEGRWEDLPDYAVVAGFVKNIASFLGESPSKTLAMFRRDYPPKDLSVNPKPDVSKTFSWGPKLTFLLGIGIIILALAGYLVFQYISFVKAPGLKLSSPEENQLVSQKNLLVSGKTNPEATVKANNQPILVSESGEFRAEVEVSEETAEVMVIAKSRAGKETVIRRKIKVEIK